MTARKGYIGECTGVIRMMKSLEEWTPGSSGHDLYYGQVFAQWNEDLARRVATYCADNFTWRPSRSDLFSVAADLESPLPSAEEVVAEILWMRDERGYLARRTGTFPKTGNPIYEAGGPNDWSHPLIGRVIQSLGGWIAVCKEHDKIGVLKAQITELWQGYVVTWKQELKPFLYMTPQQRQASPEARKYFPQWKRRNIEPNWEAPGSRQKLLSAKKEEPKLVSIEELPTELRNKIRRAIPSLGRADDRAATDTTDSREDEEVSPFLLDEREKEVA